MKRERIRMALILALFGLAVMSLGLHRDMIAEAESFFAWESPEVYPQPLPGDLDLETLSVLLDAGNLQWYLPRPEEGQWDAIRQGGLSPDTGCLIQAGRRRGTPFSVLPGFV